MSLTVKEKGSQELQALKLLLTYEANEFLGLTAREILDKMPIARSTLYRYLKMSGFKVARTPVRPISYWFDVNEELAKALSPEQAKVMTIDERKFFDELKEKFVYNIFGEIPLGEPEVTIPDRTSVILQNTDSFKYLIEAMEDSIKALGDLTLENAASSGETLIKGRSAAYAFYRALDLVLTDDRLNKKRANKNYLKEVFGNE